MSEMRRKDHRSDTLFIAMREDIYEAPKGIANIEASKAPFFSGWAIFDGEPFCLHAPQSLFQVVNLDGYLGTFVPEPPSLAMLICGVIGSLLA